MKYNLSEITDLIKNRRTIYPEQYSDRKIHKEQIEVLLNNAIWAPSHGLTQPWAFKVFMEEGREKLGAFLSETYKKLTPVDAFGELKFNRLKNRPLMAGAVIVVSLNRDPKSPINEMEEIEAIACGIQNMHLTSTAWGLGAFWATPGVIYTPEMNEFLGLKAEDKCLGLFFIGYPKVDFEWPKGHRKPIEYFTEWVSE
jgi:nitroreductase